MNKGDMFGIWNTVRKKFVKLTSSIISASPAENIRTGMSLSCKLEIDRVKY